MSRLNQYFRLTEQHPTIVILFFAAIVGVLAAWGTIVFHGAMHIIQGYLSGEKESLVAQARHFSGLEKIIVPTIGGLVAGVLLWLASKNIENKQYHSDYMEAVAIGDGRLSFKQGFFRVTSSLSTVATGGSIGREGAMVHIGGLLASVIGVGTKFPPNALRLLVACGAAGGVSAAYGAPLAGALFVAEIVIGSMSMQTLGPLLIASVSAHLTMRLTGNFHIIYEVSPSHVFGVGVSWFLFIVLGVLAGICAPQFLRFINVCKKGFSAIVPSLPLKLALGGFAFGLLTVIDPHVAGNGFTSVNGLLGNNWMWQTILFILILKVVATAITVGSGAIGGVFTPVLFVGAAVSGLVFNAAQALYPDLALNHTIFILCGMAAFLAAATNAPLMSIVMIFEMSNHYEVVVPAMLTCVCSYFTARHIAHTVMYEVTEHREQGVLLRNKLRLQTVKDLIRPPLTCMSASSNIQDLVKTYVSFGVKYVYITNSRGDYLGAVNQQNVSTLLINGYSPQDQIPDSLIQLDALPILHSRMSIDEAFEVLVRFHGERLPVLTLNNSLEGVVYKSDLIERYAQIKKSLDKSGEVFTHFNNHL